VGETITFFRKLLRYVQLALVRGTRGRELDFSLVCSPTSRRIWNVGEGGLYLPARGWERVSTRQKPGKKPEAKPETEVLKRLLWIKA